MLVGILATVALLYLSCAAFIWRAMHQPPETFGRVMSKLPAPYLFCFFHLKLCGCEPAREVCK